MSLVELTPFSVSPKTSRCISIATTYNFKQKKKPTKPIKRKPCTHFSHNKRTCKPHVESTGFFKICLGLWQCCLDRQFYMKRCKILFSMFARVHTDESMFLQNTYTQHIDVTDVCAHSWSIRWLRINFNRSFLTTGQKKKMQFFNTLLIV